MQHYAPCAVVRRGGAGVVAEPKDAETVAVAEVAHFGQVGNLILAQVQLTERRAAGQVAQRGHPAPRWRWKGAQGVIRVAWLTCRSPRGRDALVDGE